MYVTLCIVHLISVPCQVVIITVTSSVLAVHTLQTNLGWRGEGTSKLPHSLIVVLF